MLKVRNLPPMTVAPRNIMPTGRSGTKEYSNAIHGP